MKYITIKTTKDYTGDQYDKEFDSREAAIDEAVMLWNHLTDSDKKKETVFVMESVNPDEDAEDHFDGDVFWQDGKEV